ncbi:stonustoxin subunit beta-like isoform X2 [Myripristis murdjan]|uniref:stonustoxin subunit beta-like isoform X2 n=1 Tax=Myripristis murdjan TaxID=586833 RepID=UPI001175CFB2|nr:stonustoxin subunit beta-like isoform X2 [Myripristis murdjan]
MEQRLGALPTNSLVPDFEQDQLVPPSCPVSTSPSQPDVSLPADPKTRADFLKYYVQLTMDPNTVYREMCLSEGNRKVEHMEIVQPYPEHPDRFSHLYQVLCTEGLTGRCYWEVEWKGSIEIAVAYKDLSRTGYYDECAFGCNDKSWSLDINENSKCFRHNDIETEVPDPGSCRVGVYLDHKAGTLSFYSVTDTMTLLHTVQTTFTQPLYPGLWVANSAELCELE